MKNIKDKIIKETAKKFRKENGNKEIPNNDLLIYIMTKIDSLPCEPHIKIMQDTKSQLKILKLMIPIILSVIFGLIYFLHS